jgi:hypothetical protein
MNGNRLYFSWSYPEEKFALARDSLTASFAPNWQRMENALFHIWHMMPAHFPDRDLYDRTKRLLDDATKFGPLVIGDQVHYGAFEHTLRRRKRVTFERFAHEVIDIHNEILHRRGEYTE